MRRAPTRRPAPHPGWAREPISLGTMLRMTLGNRILWVLGVGFLCMNAVRYTFMNWAVQYMVDVHGGSVQAGALKSIAFPLVGAAGAIAAGWISDTLFDRRRAPVCAISLLLLAAACVGFVFVPKGSWALATAMLGLSGFLLYGPDMLMAEPPPST